MQDCNNLHDAAKAGNAAAAVRLLAAPGASEAVNSKDKLKRMPLHLAAWSGSLDVTKLLVRAVYCGPVSAFVVNHPLHVCGCGCQREWRE